MLALIEANEEQMKDSPITDWFSPEFFQTKFWFMWATTFAFEPWHSAVELKRYCHRFMHEFYRIHTLEGVERTPYNQYDSVIRPIEAVLKQKGVAFKMGCVVDEVKADSVNGKAVARQILFSENG